MAEIKLVISDEKFDEVVRGSLENIDQKALTEAIIQAIAEKLKTEDRLCNQLMFEEQGYFGNKTPSKLIMNSIEQCDMSKLQEVIDKMIDELKENYKEVLIGSITEMFYKTMEFKFGYSDTLKCVFNNHMAEYLSKNNG